MPSAMLFLKEKTDDKAWHAVAKDLLEKSAIATIDGHLTFVLALEIRVGYSEYFGRKKV